MEANSSDHLGIKFTISTKPIYKKVKGEYRKKADWAKFSSVCGEGIKVPDMPSLRDCSIPESLDALLECSNLLTEAGQQSIPQIKICTRPFIPTSYKFNRLTKVLNTLNYNYLMTPYPASKPYISSQIVKVGHLLRDEGKLLMDEYWQSLIEDAVQYLSTDPKTYWRKLLRLRGIPKSSIKITESGIPGGERVLTDLGKMEALMGAFAPRFEGTNEERIAQDSRDEMDRFFEENPDIFLPYPTADFGRFVGACSYTRMITPSEVKNIIDEGQSKAPGEDGHVKEHLRHIPKIMVVRLAHIFNAFLALGIFPDSMKCALMIFLSKPGKCPCNPANYWPISLLPVLGKIYDKILTNRLTSFLEDNDLQHPHQYGFRRGHGTTTALAMC